MSVDRVRVECRVAVFKLMDGGVGVVYVSLCRYFSNFRGCFCRDTLLSGTGGWYLIRLKYLGDCGRK